MSRNNIEIKINGESYPCRITMGAMVRFLEVTGHEFSQFDGSTKDICAFIWACVSSSAERNNLNFGMSFWAFCDNVDPDEMAQCWREMDAQQKERASSLPPDGGGEKKSG